MTTTSTVETNYWIIVSSVDNWRKTAEHGFTVQGMKSRHRKKAERMRPGDKIIYYVTGIKAFAGSATITSEYFEDHDVIWTSNNKKKAEEDYPFRVEIAKEIALPEDAFVPAQELTRQMVYARKWPAENWTLAFQGNVHNIPFEDYELIRNALDQASKAAATV